MRTEAKVTIGLIAVVLLLAAGWFLLAPQSAWRSRLTGAPTKLKAPDDCVKIINMSKSGQEKYIVYVDKEGNVKMKEYSDWGILQGEYVVDGYKEEVTETEE
jgi:hypothetical protein